MSEQLIREVIGYALLFALVAGSGFSLVSIHIEQARRQNRWKREDRVDHIERLERELGFSTQTTPPSLADWQLR